jgi:hypothetical protein
MNHQKSRKFIVPEHSYGVCLWDVDGAYLSDGDGFLSMEGVVGDKRVEDKVREAAYYWLEEKIGSPVWIRGGRKITADELDDQNARLLAGKIPDPIEAIRLAEKGNW